MTRCWNCGAPIPPDDDDEGLTGERITDLMDLEMNDFVLFGSRVEPLQVCALTDRPNVNAPYELSSMVKLVGPRGGSLRLQQVASTRRIRTDTAYTVDNLRRVDHENQAMVPGWREE